MRKSALVLVSDHSFVCFLLFLPTNRTQSLLTWNGTPYPPKSFFVASLLP